MKKKILSSLLTFLLLFSLSSTVFAEKSPAVSDKYAPTATFQVGDGRVHPMVPNGIPITVTPSYNVLSVWVGNIGVDALDNVTVTGSATDYGRLPAKSGKVPAVVGKTFTWNIPMTKTTMNYYVTITVVDGSGTRVLNGDAKLEYDDTKLASIGWHKGTFSTRAASLQYHFDKHKSEVSVNNIYDYLVKAGECRDDVANNPSNYTKTVNSGATPAHKYKNKYDGRFIILSDAGNEILSFGR
ncbi:hypothetical protein FRY98_12745 [Paenibacillus faecis]|uniref:Uncharacterized protein n=1 Tax=Paenibacillus faecis TaxID=862114 RepID=A0A5D0CUE5_9BACL|nr:hypothetical protein [Paenibacillus faecis]TYA13512.1 hypothetical protein FRY98_12745 [Paenibacillus faecis]